MKLPSIRVMFDAARQTAGRFPFSLAFAAAGSIAALILVDRKVENTDPWYVLNNLFLASTLGIALCAAAVFAVERSAADRRRSLLVQAGLAALVLAYGFTLPRDVFSPPELFAVRHALLFIAVHLLVAFAAYSRRGEIHGFWQFNKSLFLRLLLAALYTGVLQAGLSVAIAAVDNLFELNVRPERYLELWIALLGVFNTWFFFAGVPVRLEDLESDRSYPKGLKLFTQYVLLPLVVVYLVILYAYVVKIVVTWDWPKGWVANLILGFSITGIFSLLLVHPLAHRGEERWILRFTRWFYVAEIPLVVVLLLAIGRRVQEYGITENRYFVVLLGLWLAVMTIYFLVRRNASIKAIPATLFALALIASAGPWSAFSVSERSQMHRLGERLTRHGILADGKITRHAGGIPEEDARQITSIVTYLTDVHGVRPFQQWFAEPLDSLSSLQMLGPERSTRSVPRQILSAMGVPYVPEWQGVDAFRSFRAKRPAPLRLERGGLMIRGISLSRGGPGATATAGQGSIVLHLSGHDIVALFPAGDRAADTVTISMLDRVKALYADSSAARGDSLAPDRMLILTPGPTGDLLLLPSRIDVMVEKGAYAVRRFDGDLFIGNAAPAPQRRP